MRGLVVAAIVYAIATAYVARPLPGAMSNHIVGDVTSGDTLLVVWILSWDVHALARDPLNLFNANSFHPERSVLARSEHLLGQLPLFAPFLVLTHNPILAFNCAALASFVLCGLAMYALVFAWTGSGTAAFLAGLAFAFSPWRIPGGLKHAWLLQVQYLPLLLLGLERTLTTGRRSAAAWTSLALALQALCSYYLAYAAFLTTGVFAFTDVVIRGLRGRGRNIRHLTVAVAVALGVLVLPSLPYLRLKSLGEIRAPDPEVYGSLLEPLGSLVLRPASYVVLALAVAALALTWAWRRGRFRARACCLLSLAVFGALVARGPKPLFGDALNLVAWIAIVLPGFDQVRAPGRLIVLFSLAISALAGLAIARLDELLSRGALATAARGLLVTLLGMTIVLPTAAKPLRLVRIPVGSAIPAVYRWLAANGEGEPLLELPVIPLSSVRGMYFSTYHWLPLLNGYTGYRPSSYDFVQGLASQLPDPAALGLLVDCTGLHWIIAHRATGERLRAWRELPGVRTVGTFPNERNGGDWLFEVTAKPGGTCAGGIAQTARTVEGGAIEPLDSLAGTIGFELAAPQRWGPDVRALISLENQGTVAWPCTGTRPENRVGLRVIWEEAATGVVKLEESLLVPHDVAPGEQLVLPVWVSHPAAGRYVVRVVLEQARSPQTDRARPASLTASTSVDVGR